MILWRTWGLVSACLALPVGAAPLDAFLTALPEQMAPTGYLEAGSDTMNQQLDFFNIRDTNALAAGTQAGDYHGSHIRGGYRLGENFWLSGSYLQRNINGLADTYHFNSWEASGQYRFNQANGWMPAVALRLSAWGNSANEIGSSSPVAVPGATLTTVKLTKPADQQLQADLIATWQPTPHTDLSVALGAGSTQLSYGALSGSVTRNGCNYDISFQGNSILGTRSGPCAGAGTVVEQFLDSASTYGVDVAKELGWRGNFVQAGVNAAWRSGPWTLRGGYLFYAIQRESIDDILASRGWTVTNQNHNIALEANYRFHPHLSVYTRGQFSSTLIFNEMPVAYNTFSSDLFVGKYSLFSVGLRADF